MTRLEADAPALTPIRLKAARRCRSVACRSLCVPMCQAGLPLSRRPFDYRAEHRSSWSRRENAAMVALMARAKLSALFCRYGSLVNE